MWAIPSTVAGGEDGTVDGNRERILLLHDSKNQDPSMNKICVPCTIACWTYFLLHSYHCSGNCFECK